MLMLLKQANHLKAIRRGVYRSVDGIKRSWFGCLANRKAKLALKYRCEVCCGGQEAEEDAGQVCGEEGQTGMAG